MAQAHSIAPARNFFAQNVFGQPLTIFGMPVDRNTIFNNPKGRYKAGIEKRQRKLIAKTTFVNFYLKADERIRCLTTGYSPVSFLEQVLTGLAFLFFKRAFFIFTDKRILHVPARIDHFSPGAISQILYEDCAAIEIKGRALVVKYKTGKREVFPYIHRKERSRIKSLLKSLVLNPKEAGRLNGRTYLCPCCTHVLNAKNSTCGKCNLKFLSKTQAKIRALVIPGGGYFYTHFPVLGFAVGMVESILYATLVFQWGNHASGLPINLKMALGLTALLVLEKIIAAFHCRELTRDFIPVEKEFATRKMSSTSS